MTYIDRSKKYRKTEKDIEALRELNKRKQEETYGMCPHGENMVTCTACKSKIPDLKNDPKYCYFIEHKTNHKWLTEGKEEKFYLTTDPNKAMRFDGDEGKAKAKIYLHLNQLQGSLRDFIVTQHEFPV